MAFKFKAKVYLDELKEKWQLLHDTPSVFAYILNVSHRRYLEGSRFFYAELNPERTTLRRPPQAIISLNPSFDEQKFNFMKINPLELMMSIPFGDVDVSMVINKSPLTRFHTLICPNIAAGQPQRITPDCLSFSVAFLRELSDQKAYRIGYNSPGALASVNHLHLHLMYIEADLYIDKAKLQLLAVPHIYRLSRDMPTEAICFLIFQDDSEDEVKSKLQTIVEFIMWLCAKDFPHNLFVTPSRGGDRESLKVFVYVREKYSIIKDLSQYNIAFCELSGYLPVGDKNVFDSLTEPQVIAKIHEETGDAYNHIYKYFTN